MDITTQITERTLRNVVESAPYPMGVYAGYELKIILANQCIRDTFGKGDDVIGKCYTDILPELENQEIFGQLRGVLETGIPFEAKNTRVDIVIDGHLKTHYFNYNFTPVYDDNGTLFAVMNTAADVTDLQLSRQQTIEAEERLRLAAQSAELGTFEAKGTEIYASQRFYDIWGVQQQTCTREILTEKIVPDDRPIRENAHKESERTGHLDYEVRIDAGNGSVKWIRVNGTLLASDTQSPPNVVGVIQDITEQKLFAEKLRKLVKKRTRELRRSNEDLLQFAHVVSHDLKEPVRKIKIFNNLLKSELQPVLQEKGTRYLDKVQHASDRIFMMIDGILDYSMINASGNPIESVDLNTIVNNIQSDLELVIADKQATITVATMPVLQGSPILMHQLFYNLINNALKFSKDDCFPIITVECSQMGDDVIILVRDNGIGIDEKYSEQVFNAFERLHPKDKYEGTGLGLSLCKKIVERHHGFIKAHGEVGVGTEFKIQLPLLQPGKKAKV